MKQNIFKTTIFLILILLASGCLEDRGQVSEAFVENPQIRSNIDVEGGIKTFASEMAGLCPAPCNVLGATLIDTFWVDEDHTEEALQEMNDKLDRIQSQLQNVKNEIIQLRQKVHDDFIQEFYNRDIHEIKATINHVVREMRLSYLPHKEAGRTSASLAAELDEYNTLLALSVDWFRELNPKYKGNSIAEYLFMASIHCAILQELVELYKIDNYIDGGSSNPREVELNAYIRELSARADNYKSDLEEAIQVSIDNRVSYIGNVKATPIYETTMVTSGLVTIPVTKPTGEVVYSFTDRATNYTKKVSRYMTTDYTNEMNQIRNDYILQKRYETDYYLRNEVGDFILYFQQIKANAQKIEWNEKNQL